MNSTRRGWDRVGLVNGWAVEELLKLPRDARPEAAEALLRSLEEEPEEDEAEVEAAWATEIERRIEENTPGIPAETVFAEIRARLS